MTPPRRKGEVGARRTGATRRESIPPEVLRALNEGREESVTLVEWLAVDAPTLLGHVARDIGLGRDAAALLRRAEPLRKLGVTQRNKAVAALLAEAMGIVPHETLAWERLAGHSSDTARAWAAQIVSATDGLPLSLRLELAKRFATDRNMGVREIAWDSWRPHAARQLDLALSLLAPWVEAEEEGLRRCAVEGTRPRGVWTPHWPALKDAPERAASLLEPVRSDASDYVRKAVANWLNDASKSRPDWVKATCRRWKDESPTAETRWIVHRATRTLRK